MELLAVIFGLFFLVVVFGAPFRWRANKKKFESLTKELDSLKSRIWDLEDKIGIRDEMTPSESVASVVSETPAEAAPAPVAPPLEPSPPPSPPPSQAVPPSAVPEVARPGPWTAAPVKRKPEAPADRGASQAPGFMAKARERLKANLADSGLETRDWEALIGGNWLNKIGVVVLVIGLVLFLAYSLQYLGPMGKVAIGLATSLVLLGGGVALERLEKYTFFAKPLIGGGWALLYFTAYAAHSIEATKVIAEPGVGLLVLGLVAAGMVFHSLKYRSEMITGLAYALAFLALAINPLSGISFAALSILAASLLAVLWAIPWYYLGPLGVAGTYLIHLLWLQSPTAEISGAIPIPLFWLSQGMLVLYWLLFTGFAFVRKPETERQEQLSLLVNVANAVGFLGLSWIQVRNAFPDHVHVLTGGAALAYVGSSLLLRIRDRRKHHLVDGSVAVVLIAATFALGLRAWSLGFDWLAIVWLAETGAVLALGFRLREIVFRAEAYLLSVGVLGALLAFNLLGPPGTGQPIPWLESEAAARRLVLWITAVPVIAYFYGLFEWLPRVAGREDVRPDASKIGVLYGYLASALLAILLWKESSPHLIGLIWLAAGLALFEAGWRFRRLHLRIQGYALSAVALGALFTVNLYGVLGGALADAPSRWIMVPPAVVAFYYVYWRLHRPAAEGLWHATEKKSAEVSCHSATALFAVLLWKELSAVSVALAWGFLGLALFETGTRLNWKPLRFQGHVLQAMAFGRLFMANFTALTGVWGISHRLITVIPIVAMFYHLRFWIGEELKAGKALSFEKRLPDAYSFGAAVLLVVLARFEFGRAHAVVVWALLWFVFLALGIMWRDRSFRIQGYLIAVLTFARSWSTNFYLLGSFYGIPERIATTTPIIVAFLAATYLWRSKWQAVVETDPQQPAGKLLTRLDDKARLLFPFFATMLITILIFYEVEGNLLTIAWTVEALALLTLGFLTVERSFRIYGLALLAICLIKVVVIDLAGVETLFRILSFIVLGVILLLVSFAYTKYRDTIKKYV